MYLADLLKTIKATEKDAANSKVKIIAMTVLADGGTLFSGNVRKVPLDIAEGTFRVVDVFRDREYKARNPYTADYDLPYIITVM